MADISGAVREVPGLTDGFHEELFVSPIVSWPVGDLIVLRGGDIEIFYVMRGRDANCVGLTYRHWTVLDAPDYLAAKYTGAFCGGALTLTEIVIVKIGMG